MKKCFPRIAVAILSTVCTVSAALISVPNGSFEGPVTPFADPRVDSWQEYPQPPDYPELSEGPWDFKAGVFKNTDPGSADHIDNVDGAQALFLFVYPGVGIFQDNNSTDWAHPVPTHEFNATFQPGKAYQLTVGLIGGGGNMREGASLALALYYRDASSNMVVVAMTNVIHSLAVFPSTTHLVDIPLQTKVVDSSSPWTNQKIGIAIFSTLVGTNLNGGYWDVDNVRLEEIQPPLLSTRRAGEIEVRSEPGMQFDILASADLSTPVESWAVVGHVENVTGTVTWQDPSTSKSPRFYIVRVAP